MRILFLMLLYIIANSIKAQPPGESALNYTLVFEDNFDTLWNNNIFENQTYYHTYIDTTQKQAVSLKQAYKLAELL